MTVSYIHPNVEHFEQVINIKITLRLANCTQGSGLCQQ